jgi:hypothetical protein
LFVSGIRLKYRLPMCNDPEHYKWDSSLLV